MRAGWGDEAKKKKDRGYIMVSKQGPWDLGWRKDSRHKSQNWDSGGIEAKKRMERGGSPDYHARMTPHVSKKTNQGREGKEARMWSMSVQAAKKVPPKY